MLCYCLKKQFRVEKKKNGRMFSSNCAVSNNKNPRFIKDQEASG